jgi:hypothetical protein
LQVVVEERPGQIELFTKQACRELFTRRLWHTAAGPDEPIPSDSGAYDARWGGTPSGGVPPHLQ